MWINHNGAPQVSLPRPPNIGNRSNGTAPASNDCNVTAYPNERPRSVGPSDFFGVKSTPTADCRPVTFRRQQSHARRSPIGHRRWVAWSVFGSGSGVIVPVKREINNCRKLQGIGPRPLFQLGCGNT
ncbi:unnamed protein product [Rhizoctonia solani]|uniref:Uncharacterized protein n=1 Tax=Rhizoctonia solani TaxID=456999 RepID=A0A8H3GZT1_9AGAM|nr:unnamed protein product [Rhizoctonia solani]